MAYKSALEERFLLQEEYLGGDKAVNAVEPLVSVTVATYQHAHFIKECLDGILMQKTDFYFEVILGEDGSTDGTQEICKEYAEKYPDKIRLFIRDRKLSQFINQDGSTSRFNAIWNRMSARGKYIAWCEGDDYWTDPLKLQKQVDFLEAHPDYYAVAHNCIVVDKNSNPNGECYPECKDVEYTIDHYIEDILPGQTATFICRNWIISPFFDTELLDLGLNPGDRLLYVSIALAGKIYCIQERMSAYRHVVTEGLSFSATHRFRPYSEVIDWHRILYNYVKRHGSTEVSDGFSLLYCRAIQSGVIHRQMALLDGLKLLYEWQSPLITFPQLFFDNLKRFPRKIVRALWVRLRNL